MSLKNYCFLVVIIEPWKQHMNNFITCLEASPFGSDSNRVERQMVPIFHKDLYFIFMFSNQFLFLDNMVWKKLCVYQCWGRYSSWLLESTLLVFMHIYYGDDFLTQILIIWCETPYKLINTMIYLEKPYIFILQQLFWT